MSHCSDCGRDLSERGGGCCETCEGVCEPEETAAVQVRPDFITEANRAITDVRDIVTQLNSAEKDYLQKTSPTYRQLVDTIRRW